MRVVFSTDQIYLHGGIEKVMAQKANYFAEILGYEVTILTTEQKNNRPCYPLSNKIYLVDLGINYHRDKSYFCKDNLFKIPFHYSQIKKIIKKINPDVIIVANYAFDFYWMPFIHRKIPKWKEFHSSRYFEDLERKKNKSVLKKIKFIFNDWIESKYAQLIVLNPNEKSFYKSDNIIILPNPIDLNDLKANLIPKKVIAAGRIAAVKGFENAIQSWKLLTANKPDWELHIYGDGESGYIKKLENLIADNELEKSVFIKNAVANLQNQMLDYSIYLMTSRTECFPMVLLEALSVGLPIVSFDCPTGPQNIISDENDGFLVKDQNVIELSEKLIFLMDNPDQRIKMGVTAKDNSEKFSTDVIMKQWNKLLKDLKLND